MELTENEILQLISTHDIEVRRYQQMQRYYNAKQDILYKESLPNKPNNKLVHNFAGVITDTHTGYFLGVPVTYTQEENDEVTDVEQELQTEIAGEGEQFIDYLTDIFDYNDEQAHNAKVGKIASIKGRAFEVLYTDENSHIRFGAEDPEKMIAVYDNSIDPELKAAVRYFYETDITGQIIRDQKGIPLKLIVELYTADEVVSYEGISGNIRETERRPHYFGDVPVIEYPNNDERIGDFEKVLTLIDAYDKSRSNTQDDEDEFTDAILKIVNMSGTQTGDIQNVKKDKVILCDGDGDAEWLVKTTNDTAKENNRISLENGIYTFSLTPNMSDENFSGNTSGIAIKYKLWPTETKTSQKERLFKKSLQRRIEMIANLLAFLGDGQFDYRAIRILFTRNLPVNIVEKTDVVEKLHGRVSHETLLSLLPFIDDPAAELKRIEAESGGVDLNTVDIGEADEI